MKYDFDRICDRSNTNCVKWDAAPSLFGTQDVIPMWVADMDFPAAQPIIEAIRRRSQHEFLGYTRPGMELINLIVERTQRKFNWKIEPEWIVFTPGVIPALHTAIRALTHPGDEIILQEPVYHPFFPAIAANGCQKINNALKLARGQYRIDYDDLATKFRSRADMHSRRHRIKAAILCNPHNPVGRVWSPDELARFGEILIENGAVVIADEIHCEILFQGYRHTPFATLSEEFAQNSITCMAPSKTFNLAGLHASHIIIPNQKLRNSFIDLMSGIIPGPNIFGLVAMEAAYRYGDEWLAQLLDYLQANLDFLLDYFSKSIPEIKVVKPQGTYLVWLDCRGLGLDNARLRKLMCEQARVGLDDGYIFGAAGSGFQRMNIACPRPLLEEALRRIELAVRRSDGSC